MCCSRHGLQGCCGCLDLKRGSIAVGITYLVLHCIEAVLAVAALATVRMVSREVAQLEMENDSNYPRHTWDLQATNGISTRLENRNSNYTTDSRNFTGEAEIFNYVNTTEWLDEIDVATEQAMPALVIEVVMGVLLPLTLGSILCDALLIVGARRSQPRLMLAWIVYTGVLQAIWTVLQLMEMVAMVVLGSPAVEVLLSVLLLALIAAEWYWLSVVVSHYHALLRQQQLFKMQPLSEGPVVSP